MNPIKTWVTITLIQCVILRDCPQSIRAQGAPAVGVDVFPESVGQLLVEAPALADIPGE